MLRLAEIEAGSAHARFGPVDLAAIVERVAHAYRPDIEGSGRTFSVSLPARAMVAGDADLLAQALANLLDNAMVHTPRGAPIAVRLSEDAGGVRLTIQDEGPGIPLAERTRALEPFVRLDGSRTSSGAGLGLSIVNAIARLHGAQLALHDARPGLRVEIVWPASTAMSDGAPAHAAEAAPT
jgi:signal transduction histidine kinase